MIYFFIFLIILTLTSKDFFKSSTQKLEFYLVCCLFILLGGIRWETGTDWANYLYFFQINSSFDEFMNDIAFEKGYSFLNYTVKTVFNNYSVFLFILAFCTVLLKAKALYFFSSFPIFSLLIYYSFYLGDITAVRQSLAISILVFSSFYIKEKQLLLFLIFVFTASLIHLSSIAFIPAYYLFHKKISNIILLIALIIALIVGMIPGLVQKLLTNIISFVLRDDGRIALKIELYTKFVNLDDEIKGGILSLLKRVIIIPVYLLLRPYVSSKYEYYDGFLNIFIFGNILYILFYQSFPAMLRCSTPFLFYEVLLLTSLLLAVKTIYQKLVMYFIISLYCISKLWFFLSIYWDLYIPYTSIFSEE
jgi:hypothetical protein